MLLEVVFKYLELDSDLSILVNWWYPMIPVQLLNIRYYFLIAPLNMLQDRKQFCEAWGNEKKKGKLRYL